MSGCLGCDLTRSRRGARRSHHERGWRRWRRLSALARLAPRRRRHLREPHDFPHPQRALPDTRGYETLDEALTAGDAIVTESGDNAMRRWRGDDNGGAHPEYVPEYPGAQVNQLVLIYRGKRPLVLLAGELLSGG